MAPLSTLGPLPWSDCVGKYIAGAADAKAAYEAELKKLPKADLQTRCEDETNGSCQGTKAALVEALSAHRFASLGPAVPQGGVRLCHAGLAVGYDANHRNPAWVAYRLRAGEQRATKNERKGFVPDPWLGEA